MSLPSSRDECELEPLEPRLLLAGDPLSAVAGAGLVSFIGDELEKMADQGPGQYQVSYILNAGAAPVTLGTVAEIDSPTVIFNVAVDSLSHWTGTVAVTAQSAELTLGNLATAAITDGNDADSQALTATFTLTNAATPTAGSFSIGLDQVRLSVAANVVTATAANLTLAYSPSAGLEDQSFTFTSVRANLATGPPGSQKTVIDASGSGAILIADEGVAASISLSMTTGTSFGSQSFVLSGSLALRLNTTGASVASIQGAAVDLPSSGGATYVQVTVSNARLVIGAAGGKAVLTATKLIFEQSGANVTVSGVGMAFELQAGANPVVKAVSDAIAMQFVAGGFVASVVGAGVQGPVIPGNSFTLTGKVSFAVNTTGVAASLPGIATPVPTTTDGSIYIKASVQGLTAADKAVLTVAQSTVSATELTFERNATGVGLAGVDLSFELKAGAKRIVGVSGATFAFQFIEQGFFGAMINAAVQGPDFTDGSGAALFALAGTIALRVNTTTDPRNLTLGGQNLSLPAGTATTPSTRVEITGLPPVGGGTPATLTIAGSSLTATRLEFVQAAGEVSVFGDAVSLLLKAGSKRILGVSNASFGFTFNASGLVGALRNATVQGPDFTGFEAYGTASLDINTTGAAAALPGFGSIPGVANDVYIKASLANGRLAFQGNEVSATTLTFEKNGNAITVDGTGTSLILKAGAKRILTATSDAFFFQFTDQGFVGAVKDVSVAGPDIPGFSLTGLVSVQVNTTGVSTPVSVDLNGDGNATNDAVPGVSGGTYIKASVTSAALTVQAGATLTANRLDFTWNGASVALGGEAVSFLLSTGGKRIVAISNASFAFTFVADGFYGAMAQGILQGPDLANLQLQGNARFLINVTNVNQAVTIGTETITLTKATAGVPFLRVEVGQIAADNPAKLRIADNFISANKLVFELANSTVTMFGEGLAFNLMAGASRVLGATAESFYFQFSQIGFIGAMVNATATGPQFTGFNLSGVVTVLINTSGTDPPPLPIDITGDGLVNSADVVPGNPGSVYVKAIVKNAVLSIQGAGEFTAARLEFVYAQNLVSVAGDSLAFSLKAGAKRVIGVSGASFAFAFSPLGMFGALRNAAVQGPDFEGLTLAGTVGLAINTTGIAQTVTVAGTPIALSNGGGQLYVRVEVAQIDAATPATLTIAGAFSVTSALVSLELDGTSVAIEIDNMLLKVGAVANPLFEVGGSLDLRITPTQIEVASAVLTFPGTFSLGGFLSVTAPSFSLTNFVFVHSGTGTKGLISGVFGIRADAAAIFPGKVYGVAATGIDGSFNLISGAFSITLGTFNLNVGGAFKVDAAAVVIAYDPRAIGPQELVSIGNGTLTVTPLNFSGSVSELSIRTDGFSFGTLTIENTGTYNLGSILRFSHVGIEIKNFSVTYGQAIVFGGSITLFSGAAALFPNNTVFSASISPLIAGGRAMQATFVFNPDGSFRSFIFNVSQLNLTLSQYLSAKATNFVLDTGATGAQYVASFGSIEATLTIPDIITVGGSGKNFAITADGNFVTLTNFGFGFEVALDKAAKLKLPSWLPKASIDVAIQWTDFVNHPEIFRLDLSMAVDGKVPGADLELSGFIEHLVIDIGLLIEGKFPIVSLGAVGVQAGGKIAGSEIQGGLFLALMKLDAAGNEITGNANTPVAQWVLYGGVTGTLVVAGYGGLSVRLGLSQFGPLQGYVQAVVPIPIGTVTGFAITGLRGGITFGSSLPSITDARELATDPGFKTSDELTLAEWRDRLKQGVKSQLAIFNAIVNGSILDDPFGVLLQPLRFEGGGSLINLYAASAFRIDGDIIFSTDGKLMIRGNLRLGGSAITFGATMYFDVSDALSASPSVSALFLAEVPTQAKVIQIYGGIRFEYGDEFDPASVDISELKAVFDYENFDGVGPGGTYGGVNVATPVVTDLEEVRIFITGGVEISAAGFITLKIEGSADITFSAEHRTLDLEIEGRVKLDPLNVDLVGLAGVLHVQLEDVTQGGIAYEVPKVWGVFALQPAELTLFEDVGIDVDAIAVLRINATAETRTETLVIPGRTDPIEFELDPLSLSLMLDGYFTFSYGGTEWFRIDGTYTWTWSSDEDGGVAPELDGYVNGTLSVGPAGEPWVQATATGYMNLSLDGIAAKIELELIPPPLFAEVGVEVEANFVLLLNTTGEDITYQIPTEFPAVQGGRSVYLPRGPPGADGTIPEAGAPYFSIQAVGTFTVLDVFVLRGTADLLVDAQGIDLRFDGQFKLQVGSIEIHDFQARGGLRLNDDGLAVAVKLTATSDIEKLGFKLNGLFLIEINTTGDEVVVGGVTLAAGTEEYARVTLDGAVSVGTVSLVGRHYLELNASTLQVTTDATLKIGVGTGADAWTLFEFDVSGAFVVNSTGIAGRVTITLDGSYTAPSWFQYSGTFALGINTTDQVFEGIPAFLGAKIYSTGTLTLLNSLSLSGTFNFVLAPTLISVESDFAFSLKNGTDTVLSFDVEHDFELKLPGIVEDISLTLTSPAALEALGLDFDATFKLQINTTGQAHGALEAGIYARVWAHGELTINAGVTQQALTGDFYFQSKLSGLEIAASFSILYDFGGATAVSLQGAGAFKFGLSGVAARVSLTAEVGGDVGAMIDVGLDAYVILEFNTSSQAITIGEDVTIAAGPFVSVSSSGRLVLPGIVIEGTFQYITTTESSELGVTGTATLGFGDFKVLVLGVEGRLRFDGDGLVGLLTQSGTLEANLPSFLQANFDAQFTIEVNTTGAAQTLGEQEIAAGARVIASGKLDFSVAGSSGLFLQGRFALAVEGQTVNVTANAELKLIIGGETLYQRTIAGVLSLSRAGLVGQITFSLDMGLVTGGTGVTFTGTGLLEINTTGAEVTSIAGQSVNLVAGVYARLTVNGSLALSILGAASYRLDGNFRLTAAGSSVSIEATANLKLIIDGQELYSLQANGAMRLGLSGLVARIALNAGAAVQLNGTGFGLNVTGILEINLTGQAVEKIGNTTVNFGAGPFARIRGFGYLALNLSSQEVVRINGEFVIERRLTHLLVAATGDIVLKVNGNDFLRFSVNAAFQIGTGGLVGAFNASLTGGVPASFGFALNATTAVEVQLNTMASPFTLPIVGAIDPGYRFRITGTLSVPGLTLNGSFSLSVGTTQLTVAVNANFSIFGVNVNATGFAGIYYDSNPGIALGITLRVGGSSNVTLFPVSGFTITGSFTLLLNTTGVARANLAGGPAIPASTLRIEATNLNVNLFGFSLTGSLIISISPSGFSISIPAASPLTLDFFGVASLSVSGYLDTSGNFRFTAGASINIGDVNIFGFSGSLSVTFSNSGFSGSLGGTFGAFGIKVSAGGSFYIESGYVKISVYISLQITPAFSFDIWTPWETYTVHVPALVISGYWSMTFGRLTSQPLPPPPPSLARKEGNSLYLNIGADVGHRGSFYPAGDESYTIDLVGAGSSFGQNVSVTSLGYTQTYDNVTRIVVADSQTYNTYVGISNAVTVPVDINLGRTTSGTNRFFTGGGTATVQGGSVSTTARYGSGGGAFYAGSGQSSVADTAGGNVTVFAPGWNDYTLTNSSLTYTNDRVTRHTVRFTGVRNVILNGAANATYGTSSLPDPATGIAAPWTGNATFNGTGTSSVVRASTATGVTLSDSALVESGVSVALNNIKLADLYGNGSDNGFTVSAWTGSGTVNGGGGTDTIAATNDLNFVLSDGLLARSGRGSLVLNSIENAVLTGGGGDNQFEVSGWTAVGTVNGGGGSDTIVATSDLDFSLTDTQLARSGRGPVALGSIERATLMGGAASNQFVVSSWNGSASLDGQGGNDFYTVNFNGAGGGVTTINDSTGSTADDLIVNGTGGDNGLNLSATQVSLGSESINYAGVEVVAVNARGGDDTITVTGTAVATTINAGSGADAVVVNGNSASLTVNGEAAADTVTINGSTGTLLVNTADGNDLVSVRGLAGATTINTGSGTNTVNVGTAVLPASGDVNGVAGLVTVNGDGTDTLNVNDTADAADNTGLLTGTHLTGLGLGAGIAYNSIETLNLALGGGHDRIDVRSSIAHTVTSIATGGGNDTVNFGSNAPASGGTVNAIAGPVAVDGQGGADTLNVDDSADSTDNAGILTSTRLSGLGMGDADDGISYVGIESFNVSLGTGADTFNVRGTSGDALTTLNTGTGGANVVNFGSLAPATNGTLNAIAGRFVLNGQALSDTANLDDSGDVTANTGEVTSTRVTGLGMGDGTKGLEYSGVEFLNLSLGAGSDTLNVRSTAALTLTTVNTGVGAGLNTINLGSLAPATGGDVNGISGKLIVNGQSVSDTIHVDDRGDNAGNTGLLTGSRLTGLGMAGGDTAKGLEYLAIEALNIHLGAGADVFNVQGTTAFTTLYGHAGNDRVFVSSIANETQASASTTAYLGGNLGLVLGPLNLDLGTGRHALMISDADNTAGKGTAASPVRISDVPVAGLGLPVTEITITGLTPAPALTYRSDETATFADGITIWTGWGNDTVYVDGTHRRGDGSTGSTRTVTTLNTGLGDDSITVNLNANDGVFVLNTQGPENGFVGTRSDRDTVDASASTRPIVIFGGQDNDQITGGQSDDIIFGDRGLVTYFDGSSSVSVMGQGGPGDRTDGVTRPLGSVETTFASVGGNDTIFGRGGRDLIFGGLGNDSIDTTATDVSDDVLVGDHGVATYTAGILTRIETTATALGGNDTLIAGAGANVAFGGVGDDAIAAGSDNLSDIVVGDNGEARFASTNGRLLEIFTTAPGDAGADVLTSGTGGSVIFGGSFSDAITTGSGDDVIVGDNGRATFDAGTFRLSTITTTVPAQVTGAGRAVDGVTYDDVINAGSGRNVIFGGSHADYIAGLAGVDIVVGDNGEASFDPSGILRMIETNAPGSGGGDRILTSTGADIVIAGSGADQVDSGSEASGDAERDIVLGDNGHAEFDASGNLSLVYTIAVETGGNDTLINGGGSNVVFGGVGADTITAGAGSDIVVGDNGSALFDAGTHVLRDIHTTDSVQGTADAITAGAGDNVILGGTGSDTITTLTGADIVIGDNGVALFYAGSGIIQSVETTDVDQGGDDTINTGTGADIVLAGGGADQVDSGSVAAGDVSRDIVVGDNGRAEFDAAGFLARIFTTVTVTGGNDTLLNGGGNNVIFGGVGADTITAGDGNDIAVGDNGSATFDASTHVLIDIHTTAPADAGVDSINAGNGSNVVFGGAANDLLTTGSGSDIVVGDNGIALFYAGSGVIQSIETSDAGSGGDDTINTGTGADIALAGSGADSVDSGAAGDVSRDIVVGDNGRAEFDAAGFLARIFTTVTVTGGNDTLLNGGGDNVIFGGVGADTITAGDGNDIAVGDNGSAAFDASTHVLIDIHTTATADAGVDSINAGNGSNVVFGGTANDLLTTGSGSDIVVGDNGIALFYPGSGVIQSISTSDPTFSGDDTVSAGAGADIVLAGGGADQVDSGSVAAGDVSRDIVVGDNGRGEFDGAGNVMVVTTTDAAIGANDIILLGAGDNIAFGGVGEDRITAGNGADYIVGDNGMAAFDAVTRTLARISTSDVGFGHADVIVAGDGSNIVMGGSGSDTIDTGSGSDVVLGDNGYVDFVITDQNPEDIDVIASSDFGTGAADRITTTGGSDLVIGGDGGDTIDVGAGANVVAGDSAIVTSATENGHRFAGLPLTLGLVGTTAFDIGGADQITALAGHDVIVGGYDADSINAGDGDNIVAGDDVAIDYTRLDRSAPTQGADANATDVDLITSLSPTAFGGADVLTAGEGNDIILGGRFGDTIQAGNGNNLIFGDSAQITAADADTNRFGAQEITLGALASIAPADGGNDGIVSGSGNDLAIGGFGGDTITTNGGNDIAVGDNAAATYDPITQGLVELTASSPGDSGVDVIDVGDGNNLVLGGGASDTLTAGSGNDVMIGDSGTIALNAAGALVSVTTDESGLGGDDTIHAGAGNDLVLGGAGSDTIHGESGNDLIFGDDGHAQFNLDGVAGTLDAATTTHVTIGGPDTIHGGAGDDIIVGATGSDLVFAGSEHDIVWGDFVGLTFLHGLLLRGETIFNADGDADTLRGESGQDVLVGGAAADRVDGGSDEDLVVGDNALIDRTGRVGNLTAGLFRSLSGTQIYDLHGNALLAGVAQTRPGGDAVWADFVLSLVDHSLAVQAAGSNRFGADYLAGGAAHDRIFGGLGDDTIQGDGSIEIAVSAGRAADGTLRVTGTVEAATDGDDYIEGNGGRDLIFGGLGQDDIIGGSSELFGLTGSDLRPDTADLIFGGAGTDLARADAGDTSATGHARDADTIAGDNANIHRLVGSGGAGGYLTFGYDTYGSLRIIPRAVQWLDYTPGGIDLSPTATGDIGAADEIHGESGDDTIYGQLGDDVLFGEGQDDDLVGGTGADWIAGGNGDDGVLGEDGRLYTSRNGIAEPLYGIAAIPEGGLNLSISTPGNHQTAVINVAGELKKTAMLEPFQLTVSPTGVPLTPSNDIIFGGLGNDAIHGGAGDDALSGAEALPQYYAMPFNPGNVLGWGTVPSRAGEFAAYDQNNPRAKIYVNPTTYVFAAAGSTSRIEFILNFAATEQDGDDVLFGDLGNDWIVGGLGRDNLYGGYGDDLLNVDDNHETAGGLNNVPDVADATQADLAYGGAGRDILIANQAADRLIDWNGEFNSYWVPFSSFGSATVSRTLQPQLMDFLYDLSASDGADTTRVLKTGGSAVRNGEPFGELGLVNQTDADWNNQQGAPADPQAGNIPGTDSGKPKGKG